MLNVLAQTTSNNSSGFGAVIAWFYFSVIILAAIVAVIGIWKMYQKADQPGWAAIVPVYNVYVLIKVAGRPEWWIILYFIPLVNIIISVILALDIAKRFGQSEVFGIVLLWLFSAIGYAILGFGEAEYKPAPNEA